MASDMKADIVSKDGEKQSDLYISGWMYAGYGLILLPWLLFAIDMVVEARWILTVEDVIRGTGMFWVAVAFILNVIGLILAISQRREGYILLGAFGVILIPIVWFAWFLFLGILKNPPLA